MTPFYDLPDRICRAARDAIDAAGGSVAGYRGPYVQVAIPHPSGPFFDAMEAAGPPSGSTSNRCCSSRTGPCDPGL
jgi:hypothetical protein